MTNGYVRIVITGDLSNADFSSSELESATWYGDYIIADHQHLIASANNNGRISSPYARSQFLFDPQVQIVRQDVALGHNESKNDNLLSNFQFLILNPYLLEFMVLF